MLSISLHSEGFTFATDFYKHFASNDAFNQTSEARRAESLLLAEVHSIPTTNLLSLRVLVEQIARAIVSSPAIFRCRIFFLCRFL